MPENEDLLNEMGVQYQAHKDYAGEIKQISTTLKLTVDDKEEYRDWENFPDGSIQTKITPKRNPITGKPITPGEKAQIIADCKIEWENLKARKPT